jgi:hypothetical protein
MFSNIVSNTGLLGFFFYSALVLLPVFMMKHSPDRQAIRAALISIYMMEMLTVSEYSYLPPWFFVALGYVRCRKTMPIRSKSRTGLPIIPKSQFARSAYSS